MRELEARLVFDEKLIDAKNLCDQLSEEDLSTISEWCWDGFCRDKQSRADWEKRSSAAMDLAMQVQKAKSFPWPNCSNIIFPLVSIAALQFSTRSYANLIRGTQVVKYRVIGEDDDLPELTKQAKLIGNHMSWQVLEEDQSWEEQHDRLFINLAIVGCAFIKTRYNAARRHNVSELVMARDLVVDYNAKSIESAARKTQIIEIGRNEIWERCQRGIYRDVRECEWFKAPAKIGAINETDRADHDARVGTNLPQGDQDTPFVCLEQHRFLDLDGDGYAEPYIVLFESASREILRIVARVERPEDVERNDAGEIISIKPTEYFTKYGFIPAPDGGIYDMGFGSLVGPLNETVNTAINQIFDAGTSNMLGGGFMTSGAKMKAGTFTRTPGEWKLIKGAADDIRKSMVAHPEIPISNVLFQLLSLVIQYSDRLAGTVATTVGENPGQNTPAQTYQGMIEQGMQIYRSIFKRVWRSMKEEFKKLHQLNARYLAISSSFGSPRQKIRREDYKTDPDFIVPVADPNLVSDQMRLQRSGAVRQAAYSVPGYNIQEAETQWLEDLGVDDIGKVYPGAYSDFAKRNPLPNPKLQVEQAKLQGLNLKIQSERWKTILQLQAEQQEVQARIELMHAQAAALVAKAGGERDALQLEAFNTVMEHLHKIHENMTKRIQALSSMKQEGETDNESETDQSRGAGGDQSASGGKSPLGLPAPAASGAA